MKQQRLSAARQTEIAARQSDLHVDNGVYICPQAWYLSRRGVLGSAASRQRLLLGSAAHRSIGRRSDRIRVLEHLRRFLLLVIIAVIAVLLAQTSGVVPFRPW